MGLRINTRLPSLFALKQLRDLDAAFGKTFERMSTGREINRASEGPARMAIADSLRAEIASLRQTIENASHASNLLATADAAMGEVEEILQDVERSLIFAMNRGAATPSQILAEQDSVDQSIAAIRRLSGASRFGDINLLNGGSAIIVESFDSANIIEVRPFRAQFNPVTSTTGLSITVTASGTQATALLASSAVPTAVAASGGTVELRLQGPRGSAVLNLASGATSADMDLAINSRRELAGLYVGDLVQAHRQAGRQAKKIGRTVVPQALAERCDVALVSAYPLDTDPIQMGKSINLAKKLSARATVVVVNAATDGVFYHGMGMGSGVHAPRARTGSTRRSGRC